MMRNAAVTTVAPTGTISIIANCSGGIEPLFSLAFLRNVLRGQKQGEKPLVEVNETFREVAKARGFYSEELIERIAREGTLAHIDSVPEDIRRIFVCAHDITPDWHMKMQGAFQRHCDSSISKTINFPNAATPADVEQIYQLAYEMRCKGVTVYRDGCRSFQPMALKNGNSPEAKAKVSDQATKPRNHEGKNDPDDMNSRAADAATSKTPDVLERGGSAATREPTSRVHIEPMDLPEIVSGLRIRQITPFGNMHVKITVDPRADRELEVFAQLGKGGDVATSDLEGMCRMISLWLRAGGSLRHAIKQLEGIGSSLQIPTRAGRIVSLPDGLACALKKYIRAKERFGLRPLLLGEVDLALLDSPPPPHAAGLVSVDRTVAVDRPPIAPTDRAPTAPPASPATNPPNGHDRIIAAGVSPMPPAGSGPIPAVGPAPLSGAAAAPISAVEKRIESGVSAVKRSGRGSSRQTPRSKRSVAGREGNTNGNGDGNGHAAATAVLEPPGRASLLNRLVETDAQTQSLTGAVVGATALIASDSEADELMFTSSGLRSVPNPFDARIAAAPESLDNGLRHAHESALHYKLKCPQCEGVLALQEGCKKCHSCGWTAC
jgi:hypothetical protein